MKKVICILLIVTIALTSAFADFFVTDLAHIAQFFEETGQEALRWTEKLNQWKVQYDHILQSVEQIKAQMARWKSLDISNLSSFMSFINSVNSTLSQMETLNAQLATSSTAALKAANDIHAECNDILDDYNKNYLEYELQNDFSEGSNFNFSKYKSAWEQELEKQKDLTQETNEIIATIKTNAYELTQKELVEVNKKIQEAEEGLGSVGKDGGVSAEQREQYLAQLTVLYEQRKELRENLNTQATSLRRAYSVAGMNEEQQKKIELEIQNLDEMDAAQTKLNEQVEKRKSYTWLY